MTRARPSRRRRGRPTVDRLREMHSHVADGVAGRMRDSEQVRAEEVAALLKLETTIELRKQVERIRELTTDAGSEAEAGGGAAQGG